ncbi:MAG: hypothetical protein CMP14_01990, partial [Rickettsiales bacterium]|nr:hypothetical protein [Rickettsiales bacterium]
QCNAVSYNLCKGADVSREFSVLALTRNTAGDLISSKWLGADTDPENANTMALLNSNEGNVVRADGSALAADDADMSNSGEITGRHNKETGGVNTATYKLIVRCGGDPTIPDDAAPTGAPMIQFVRLNNNDKGHPLNLAEIEVYSGGKNVALNKKTSDKGGMCCGAKHQNGVNGKKQTSWSPSVYIHTHNGAGKWWQVDLGQGYPVDEIKVYNRQNCCRERFVGAKIQFFDPNMEVVSEVTAQGTQYEHTYAP